jgi:hypothetical protein
MNGSRRPLIRADDRIVSVYDTMNSLLNRLGLPRDILEATQKKKPLHLFDAACVLSCSVPLAWRKVDRERYADEAMQTLRAAVTAGWGRPEWAPRDTRAVNRSIAAWTAHDPDLFPLHDRDDFQRLVAQLFDRDFPTDPFAP